MPPSEYLLVNYSFYTLPNVLLLKFIYMLNDFSSISIAMIPATVF